MDKYISHIVLSPKYIIVIKRCSEESEGYLLKSCGYKSELIGRTAVVGRSGFRYISTKISQTFFFCCENLFL